MKYASGLLSLVFLSCFLFGTCFKPIQKSTANATPIVEQTQISKYQPIESVQLGQRVATDITPHQLKEAIGNWADLPQWDRENIQPKSWRAISLNYEKPNGGILKIELLRPLEWLADQHAQVGANVHLVMEGMGVDGPATVISISPCPPISKGSGRVVTGRFSHVRGGVLQLRMNGIEEPLGVTENHPIYSVDKQGFVAAEDLRIGESLQLQEKTTQVAHIGKLADQVVFNLEVQGEHVYRVSKFGMLVHNDCVKLFKAPQRGRTGVEDEVIEGFSKERYPGDGPYFTTDEATAVNDYQYHYENGLQEIRIPRSEYDRLVKEGKIVIDGLEKGAVNVPAKYLDEFNEVLKQGPENIYHPQ